MNHDKNQKQILLVEDNEDHYILIRDALREAGFDYPVHRVEDGQALLEYLLHQGRYRNSPDAPRPHLILLDLNLPRKDGREALKEIKSHPRLRQIPVVVLTTSQAEEDVFRSYELGANAFIKKPLYFDQLVECMKTLIKHWLEVVELRSS